ncbi:MAG: nitroreductase family deazaflavin-dependent oxidoreductase, partial [Kineosporiaceae bacterium]
RQTPAWVTNILAKPEATVRFRDESISVVAVELAGADRAELLRAAVGVYPGFGRYETRARHRRVHVFALDHDPPNDTG